MHKPFVLIVDDRPESGGQILAETLVKRGQVSALALHPLDVTLDELSYAKLLLVDFRLDNWPDINPADGEAYSPPICRIPANGLALTSILRAHSISQGRYPAVCLLSAVLADVFGGLNPENRRHVLARQTSLEWIFKKESDQERSNLLCEQIEALAIGVSIIHGHSADQPLDLRSVLMPPGDTQSWTEEIEASVRGSLPPVSELQQLTHGLAFARWMLQRILPYPTFLLDENYLSAKLGVSPASLTAWLSSGSELGDTIYRGVFSDFLGKRWWRAGIDAWLWEETNGESFKKSSIQAALSRISGGALEFVKEISSPVVCVGVDFESTPNLRAREECIKISPDDWPSFAEAAFVTLNEAKTSPELRALVPSDEKWRLED